MFNRSFSVKPWIQCNICLHFCKNYNDYSVIVITLILVDHDTINCMYILSWHKSCRQHLGVLGVAYFAGVMQYAGGRLAMDQRVRCLWVAQGESSPHTLQGWLPAFNRLHHPPPQMHAPWPPFSQPTTPLPLNFPFPTFTLFSSPDSIFTLYCRVSQQSRLHWSGHCGHIPDCEKAAEEPEGGAGGDRGPTFSWENNYVGDQKENEDNCTFVLEKTPWGLVGCSQNQNQGSRPLMTMMIIKMTVLTAVLMTITMIMMDNIDMCEY